MTNKITKVYKNWVEYDIYASGWAAWTGDVTWPSSSTDADIALFDWATWKIIKDSWKKLSNYQTALSTQTAYTSKGSATKVPTITTNTLWQVTAISETNITYPSQVSDDAYGSSWDWVTTTAPSKNVVYDKISAMDTTIASKLSAETVVSGDSGTTYTIKVSSSEPASWTSATTITFVTA